MDNWRIEGFLVQAFQKRAYVRWDVLWRAVFDQFQEEQQSDEIVVCCRTRRVVRAVSMAMRNLRESLLDWAHRGVQSSLSWPTDGRHLLRHTRLRTTRV